jgi:hypothetical protein
MSSAAETAAFDQLVARHDARLDHLIGLFEGGRRRFDEIQNDCAMASVLAEMFSKEDLADLVVVAVRRLAGEASRNEQ